MSKDNQYPCLCEAIRTVLFWTRILGVLPVSVSNIKHTKSKCGFKVTKGWIAYSCTLLLCHLVYTTTAFGLRMYCGSDNPQNASGWYVVTFGYFILSANFTITLAAGSYYSRSICTILQHLSFLQGRISEMRTIRKQINIATAILLTGSGIVFLSLVRVAWIRAASTVELNFWCYAMDKPTGVIIRGLAIFCAGAQLLVVMILALLVSGKFEKLADETSLILAEDADDIRVKLCYNISPGYEGVYDLQLIQLETLYNAILSCLNRINKCISLPVLCDVTTCVYTIVYYFYRYCTAKEGGISRNSKERFHYLMAGTYRICRLLAYVVMGHSVSTTSNKPLIALQQARILHFPSRLQQQVQSLMLQWYGKRSSTISAYGIINLGPWLLPPIVGNIITYLLVALQFEECGETTFTNNVTAVLESFNIL